MLLACHLGLPGGRATTDHFRCLLRCKSVLASAISRVLRHGLSAALLRKNKEPSLGTMLACTYSKETQGVMWQTRCLEARLAM